MTSGWLMSSNAFSWVLWHRHGRGQKKNHRIFIHWIRVLRVEESNIKTSKTGEQVMGGQFYGSESIIWA